MTSKEAVKLAYIEFQKDLDYDENNQWLKNVIEGLKEAEKDLEVLETLKPRISLKDKSLKNTYLVIDENGMPELKQCLKDIDVSFIEASGFVFKDSDEHKLLKEWLENVEEND